MNINKFRFWKRFSIIIGMYVWFIIIVLYSPMDVLTRYSWIATLLIWLFFSYKTCEIIEEINGRLKKNDKLKNTS